MKKILLCLALAMLLSVGVKAEEVKTVNAVKSSQKVSVDGKTVEIDAYNIDGSNYFKLRDVAVILSGTDKEFDVGFDKEQNAITIEPGKAYSKVKDGVSEITKESAKGVEKSVKYIIDNNFYYENTINIDNSNYLKLRNLGVRIGFETTYNAKDKEIIINTKDIDYVEEKEYNDGDDKSMLGSVSIDSIRNFNKNISGDYKIDVEENGDKVKFYVNYNGKRERFYTNEYNISNMSYSLNGEPVSNSDDDYFEYGEKLVAFLKDISDKVEKSGGYDMKLKFPYYNMVYFVSKNEYSPKIGVELNCIMHNLVAKSDKGYDLPVQFCYPNSIGAAAPTNISNIKTKSGDVITSYNTGIIPLGKIKPYTIDKDGNIKYFGDEFTNPGNNHQLFDDDISLMVIDYTLCRIKGKILVYLVK